LILSFSDFRDGVETHAGTCAVYDVARDEAHFGAARVEGRALVWELGEAASLNARLTAALDVAVGDGRWLLRGDRVDFPPGGVAYEHTHPGPGIRCLLFGTIRIESGDETHEYASFEPWFEAGPEPVFAVADENEPSAFVRVLVLPGEWEGKRTIRYVDPADEEKPKLQRATVYFERPIPT
jgi:quercetin dioxygenase-like cupin family protein